VESWVKLLKAPLKTLEINQEYKQGYYTLGSLLTVTKLYKFHPKLSKPIVELLEQKTLPDLMKIMRAVTDTLKLHPIIQRTITLHTTEKFSATLQKTITELSLFPYF
jgi:hypothetical protein